MASKASKLGLKAVFSLGLVLVGVFLIKTPAEADISQLISDTQSRVNGTMAGQTLGAGLSGNLSSFTLGFSYKHSSVTQVNVYLCASSSSQVFSQSFCTDEVIISSSTTDIPDEIDALHPIIFSFTPVTLNPLKYYGILMSPQGGVPNVVYEQGSASSSYSGGKFYTAFGLCVTLDNMNADCEDALMSDIYFILGNANAPLSASLELRKPFNRFAPLNGASTTDFYSWFVNVTSTDLTNLSTTTLTVFYDRLSTSTFSASDTIGFNTARGEIQLIPKANDLIFPPLVNGTTWYARADIKSGGVTFAQSPLATFQVNFGNAYSYSTSTTINNLNASCEADSNIFASSICKWLLSLFYPSNEALSQFGQFTDLIGSKPPLGYYFAVQGAISNSLIMGTSTNAILNASATSAMAPVFTPIRNILIWVLWIIGGLFVFNKIRHLNF
jgi:hypothetical protein